MLKQIMFTFFSSQNFGHLEQNARKSPKTIYYYFLCISIKNIQIQPNFCYIHTNVKVIYLTL